MKNLFFYIMLLLTTMSYSQQDLTLYFLENVPQRQYLNPAFRPKAKLNIGLPAISSIYVDHINTTFTPSNLFETNNGTTTLTIDKLKENIKETNYFGLTTKIDLFSLGFQINKSYFSFNVTENLFSRLNLSKGFLELPLYGNADFSQHGGKIDMSNTGVNFSHYREYGFGWQRKMSEKLDLGVKVKFLSGKSNAYVKKNSFVLQTNENNYDWTIKGELEIRSSGFDSSGNLMNNQVASYLLNKQNKGLGIDIGATYKISDKIKVNASLVDFGFIKWKSEVNNIKTKDASFSFTGVDLTEFVYAPDSVSSDSLEAAFRRLRDAAENELGYSENKNSYTQALVARFHFGGTYRLYKRGKLEGKLGALVQAELYNKSIRPSFTLSYNQNIGSWLNATVAYSMINKGYNNLGLGFSVNLGPLQVFTSIDNIFAAQVTSFKKDGADLFVYPTNSKKAQVHFGINLIFGAKKATQKLE